MFTTEFINELTKTTTAVLKYFNQAAFLSHNILKGYKISDLESVICEILSKESM